ncbi:hypothetical protein LCGC14_0534180 [marine sediment metagenome]|uniref:Uncharacterized protein n=1 Tax=marine sediment metagenome TaxID=412755 RepID=A0A0F9RZC4_9ZZZZ
MLRDDIKQTQIKSAQDELNAIRALLTDEEKEALFFVMSGKADIMDNKGLWEKLYGFYWTGMPYGTAKARTGDPAEWIYDQLVDLLN